MSGRTNHRGWVVLESISSTDGWYCVDFFRHDGGGYGFEHFRSDPEGGGRWQIAGGFGENRFDSALEAAEAGSVVVPWLMTDHRAKRGLESWFQYLQSIWTIIDK